MKRIFVLLAISLLFNFTGVLALRASENADATADAIATIRSRYATINKNQQRYRKVKKDFSGYSAEGGTMEAYLDGKAVMKIVATHFGESGRAVEEYYYWDGRLIFVYRRDSMYDNPSSAKVVSTSEDRFYFDNDKLIRWIGGSGQQVPSAQNEYGEKQSYFLKMSSELLKLAGV